MNFQTDSYITTANGVGVIGSGDTDDIVSVDIQPLNFVSVNTSGIDFEASYRHPVGPGDLSVRALASYAIEQKTDNGLSAVTDAAGQNTGSLPDWTYRASVGYDLRSGFSVQGIVRGVSGGVYNSNYVICSTDCPVSTTDFRTININKIKGATYFDMNASYSFKVAKEDAQVFLAIINVLTPTRYSLPMVRPATTPAPIPRPTGRSTTSWAASFAWASA